MIKPLRKRHLQVWIATAFLLPAGIVLSWLAIPNNMPVKLLQSQTTALLPVIRQTKDGKDYLVHLRSNAGNTQWQLEWKNKAALTVPTAVIYRVRDAGIDLSKAELIGRIEARGNYVFALEPDPDSYKQVNLVVYDFIHEKIIDSINFQP